MLLPTSGIVLSPPSATAKLQVSAALLRAFGTMNSSTGEIAGLLIGSTSETGFRIDRCEPLLLMPAGASAYADRLIAELRQAQARYPRTAVGFFRSQMGDFTCMGAFDVVLARTIFPASGVFVGVQHSKKASFYSWSEGPVAGAPATLELALEPTRAATRTFKLGRTAWSLGAATITLGVVLVAGVAYVLPQQRTVQEQVIRVDAPVLKAEPPPASPIDAVPIPQNKDVLAERREPITREHYTRNVSPAPIPLATRRSPSLSSAKSFTPPPPASPPIPATPVLAVPELKIVPEQQRPALQISSVALSAPPANTADRLSASSSAPHYRPPNYRQPVVVRQARLELPPHVWSSLGRPVTYHFKAQVDPTGKVTDAQLISRDGDAGAFGAEVGRAALIAARLFVYRPGTLNGKPIQDEVRIDFVVKPER